MKKEKEISPDVSGALDNLVISLGALSGEMATMELLIFETFLNALNINMSAYSEQERPQVLHIFKVWRCAMKKFSVVATELDLSLTIKIYKPERCLEDSARVVIRFFRKGLDEPVRVCQVIFFPDPKMFMFDIYAYGSMGESIPWKGSYGLENCDFSINGRTTRRSLDEAVKSIKEKIEEIIIKVS